MSAYSFVHHSLEKARKNNRKNFLVLSMLLLSTGCISDLKIQNNSKVSDQDLSKLIQQTEGNACYWNEKGEALDPIMPGTLGPIECKKDAAFILEKLAENEVRVNRAVPALINNLKLNGEEASLRSNTVGLRVLSVQALGAIRDPRAIDGLLELIRNSNQSLIIKSDDDFESSERKSRILALIKVETIIALGQIGVRRPDVIQVLEQGLRDPSNEVRKKSALFLAELKETK
jgi:PBS lyase HEAT-like repeat